MDIDSLNERAKKVEKETAEKIIEQALGEILLKK